MLQEIDRYTGTVNLEGENIIPGCREMIHKHGIGYQFQFFFRKVAPVGFLHFKAVLAEQIGADNSPGPSLAGKAECGVNPKGVCAQFLFVPQVAVEIVYEVFRQFFVSHIGTLPLLPHEGFEVLVNGQVLVIGGLRTEYLVVVVVDTGFDLFQLRVDL